MKKYLLFLVILVILLNYISCKKIDQESNSYFGYTEVTFLSLKNHNNKDYLIFSVHEKRKAKELREFEAILLFDGYQSGDKFYVKNSAINDSWIAERELIVDVKTKNTDLFNNPDTTPDPKIDIENNGTVNIYMDEDKL